MIGLLNSIHGCTAHVTCVTLGGRPCTLDEGGGGGGTHTSEWADACHWHARPPICTRTSRKYSQHLSATLPLEGTTLLDMPAMARLVPWWQRHWGSEAEWVCDWERWPSLLALLCDCDRPRPGSMVTPPRTALRLRPFYHYQDVSHRLHEIQTSQTADVPFVIVIY